jgi:hypothetical protein
MEINNMKKIFFSSYESVAPTTKLETSVSKTKGLENFAWIRSGVVVEEAFKDWKTFWTSTPLEKNWSILINKVRGATIEE